MIIQYFINDLRLELLFLVIYVDDIVITRDNEGISSLKSFLHTKFHMKDLGHLKYFLGIEC